MKRVGILTFHSANNYGACLQAYALQEASCKLGAKCEIIRFKGEKRSISLSGKRTIQKRINNFVVRAGATAVKTLSEPSFNRFRKEYFNYSEVVNPETITKLNSRYDLFLSGSDQVWNCDITDNLDLYLQTFVTDDNKKGSYAASFGMAELPDQRKAEYAQALSHFKYLGVREPEGAEIIRNLTGREASVVIDPTQLLDVADWERIMRPIGPSTPYIFVYQLGLAPNVLRCAKKLSKETGLRLVFVPFPEVEFIPGKYYPAISPAQFIYLIRNAQFVVTNSFHGTLFSIGFHRNFYTDISESLAALGSRIKNLLDRYHLNDRLIKDGQAEYKPNIDYTEIEFIFQQDREKSLSYLQGMLKE